MAQDFVNLQEYAVEYVGATMEKLYGEDAGPKRLFLIQTYNIGKERVFLEVSGYRGRYIQAARKVVPSSCSELVLQYP